MRVKNFHMLSMFRYYSCHTLLRLFYWDQSTQSKYRCKDQESIQSSTTPDPGYQWESDKHTEDTTNESQEVSPFPAGDHKATRNRPDSTIHTNIKPN